MSDSRLPSIPVVKHHKPLNSHPLFTLAYVKRGSRILPKAGSVPPIRMLLKGFMCTAAVLGVSRAELWLEVNHRASLL